MLTIGADVEVFVRDTKTKELTSAIDFIKGTKHNPESLGRGMIQHDNILAEFNVIPATDKMEFIINVLDIIAQLKQYLGNHGQGIDIQASAVAPQHLLKHPEAQRFGCEADFNVWRLDVEYKVDALTIGDLRTAGGHIHIGWDGEENLNNRMKIAVAKACDFFLGVPSILYDQDTQRRRFYGQAGHFRSKPYGIEYRVLSNFWIKRENWIKWAFENARRAYYDGEDFVKSLTDKDVATMTRAINTSDKKLAETIIKKFDLKVA